MNANGEPGRSEVALIGIGLLGSAVADRLVAAGYPLRGFDLVPARQEDAARAGVRVGATAVEAVTRCEVVLTCLPDGPAVLAALFEGGIAEALAPGSVVADFTTGAPGEAREAAGRLAERGIAHLDTPVSGSSAQVRAGQGLVMAGGPAETFARCRPLLEAVGRAVHAGPSGAGVAAKLISNLVLGLNRLALAEGLVLAERAGLELPAMLELLRAGAAYSRVMDTKGERMTRRRFSAPEARLRQHLKDVDLILDLGEELSTALPLSALHREILARAVELGCGDLDNAAVIEALRGSTEGTERSRK